MKVIGAGLPRTATTTQLVVLEALGFDPCYHMRDLLGDLAGGLPAWERVLAGDADWEAILGHAQSCCDWPTSYFYGELAEYYPDAKVLLSVRSGESWAQSMRETIWPMYFGHSVMHHLNEARSVVEPEWRRFMDLMIALNWDPETGAFPGGGDADDDGLATLMERWNEKVKATIPAERLFVWHPADGWDGLCEFLEVPVPEDPVPHVNDTPAFTEGILGGALAKVNAWWDARERPSHSLHGAPVAE